MQAVAVCFLHSYRHPEHERRVAALLREELPEVRLSLSCEVSGEIREYERTSTTLANVYVQRVTERYLDRIQGQLEALGSPARLLVMLSSGGLATVETARRFPVRMIESGPGRGGPGGGVRRAPGGAPGPALLRHGGHHGQGVPGGGGAAPGGGGAGGRPRLPLQEGQRAAHPLPGGGVDRDRGRRGLDRPGGHLRADQGGPGERRGPARPGLLRAGGGGRPGRGPRGTGREGPPRR